MSVSLWRWTEECDTHLCIGDCDYCDYNNEDEDEVIKPCPFCGSKDLKITPAKDTYYRLLKKNGMACISIECGAGKCYAEMYEHNDDIKNYDEKCKALIKKWNTRAYTIQAESVF